MKNSRTAARQSEVGTWERAQSGEKQFWVERNFNKEYLDAHANDFRNDVKPFLAQLRESGMDLADRSKVLQIGSALFDLIDFIECGPKFTVEPLEGYFQSLHDEHRDPSVARFQGMAEKLPPEIPEVDLIISHNMLDHVDDPSKVLAECHRVLAPGGRMWLQVHVFDLIGVFLKSVILSLHIDEKHLHFWTKKSFHEFLKQQRFEILSEFMAPDQKELWYYIRRTEWRPIVKRMIGIAPWKYTVVLTPLK